MGLSNKQINYYKPLITKKLESLGVQAGIGYTKTGTARDISRYVTDSSGQRVQDEAGNDRTEVVKQPHYRATNLQKSITKKLLKLDVPQVERFLTTEPASPKSEEILVASPDGEVP